MEGGTTLTRLVRQIAEIVAAGEDSGSQHSDGTVPQRLRSVVLTLLDQVVSSSTGERLQPRRRGAPTPRPLPSLF